jgi:NADH dehydrogenase
VELVLWTVGNTVPELITNISLEKNGQGLLEVNQFLQVKGHDFIYALGDIAQINQDIPKTAQAAIQQADFCAWNIWASINNKPLLPFRYSALGEMLSLGIDDASISGLGINLEGILGYLTRRMVYLYRLPTLKHQMNVGLHWLTQPIFKNFS